MKRVCDGCGVRLGAKRGHGFVFARAIVHCGDCEHRARRVEKQNRKRVAAEQRPR